MTDPRTDAGTSGSDRLRAAVAGQEFGSTDPAQATSSDLPDWDWPPVSYAENDHILVWWLPEYDDMLRQLVDEYQWAWQSQVLTELPSIGPRGRSACMARGRSAVPGIRLVQRPLGLRGRPGQTARHSPARAAARRVLMLLSRISRVAPSVALSSSASG